ncbi:hypothetical protein Droror1_Dr00010932 [Drosera rotundifolia]
MEVDDKESNARSDSGLNPPATRQPQDYRVGFWICVQDSWARTLSLAFQSIRVIYGDIGTSPLYVYSSTFTDGIKHNDDILGVLSLIVYTIVLLPMIKYLFIVQWANDNGDEIQKKRRKSEPQKSSSSRPERSSARREEIEQEEKEEIRTLEIEPQMETLALFVVFLRRLRGGGGGERRRGEEQREEEGGGGKADKRFEMGRKEGARCFERKGEGERGCGESFRIHLDRWMLMNPRMDMKGNHKQPFPDKPRLSLALCPCLLLSSSTSLHIPNAAATGHHLLLLLHLRVFVPSLG